jgi:hypothetical protein
MMGTQSGSSMFMAFAIRSLELTIVLEIMRFADQVKEKGLFFGAQSELI